MVQETLETGIAEANLRAYTLNRLPQMTLCETLYLHQWLKDHLLIHSEEEVEYWEAVGARQGNAKKIELM